MKTAIQQRFINSMNMNTLVKAGVMDSISKTGHRVVKSLPKENRDEYEEFVVGQSIVGEKNVIGSKKGKL